VSSGSQSSRQCLRAVPGGNRAGAKPRPECAGDLARLGLPVRLRQQLPKCRLSREEALRLWTEGSSWFSSDTSAKGAIQIGQLADLAVLSADYFTIPQEEIKSLESVLTVVGGNVVYAA